MLLLFNSFLATLCVKPSCSKGMMDGFRGSPENINEDIDSVSFPILFPPAIWHRPEDGEEVLINQSGACMIYLGDVLGYAPSTPAERARATAVMLNCMDYIAEGRSSFHPVKNTMSYHDQKEEGDKFSKEFCQSRMKNFLLHFNKVVKGNRKAPVARGPGVTCADFALFHVLDATVSQFNNDFYDHAWDKLDAPDLKEYYMWMKSRPKLQAYFQSDRCVRKKTACPFCLCMSLSPCRRLTLSCFLFRAQRSPGTA